MFNTLKIIVPLALLSAMVGCATTPPSATWPVSDLQMNPAGQAGSAQNEKRPDSNNQDESTRTGGIEQLPALNREMGSSTQSALSNRFSSQNQVQAAVDGMPPEQLVHYVFGDLLKANYILANSVGSGGDAVSLNINEEISERRLFQLVQQALAEQDIYIRGDAELLYIYRQSRERRPEVSVGVGRSSSSLPEDRGQILQIVPLRYGNPASFNNLMQHVVGANNITALPDTKNGVMYLYGKRDSVERSLELIRLLDIPPARGRHVALRELTYISPEAFQKEVRVLLQAEGINIGEPGSGDINLVSLDRIGAVAVFASSQDFLNRITLWADKLDVPGQGARREYFVYNPEYSNVKDLGETVKDLLDLEGRPQGGSSDADDEGNSEGSSSESGLVIDEGQNSLIFYITASSYQRLLPLIKRMDRQPNQVLLEVTVAELTLEGRLEQGLEWFLRRSDFSIGTEGGLGIGGDGLNAVFNLDGGRLDILFNFFQQRQQINILSSPRLLVLDGSTATINVGDDVPVITTQATDADAVSDRIVQSVQYRSTGITLTVTPQVNSRGLVVMEIEQEVSEAGENVLSGVQSPIILQRKISTEVLTPDGSSVILGGLIRENNSSTKGQVPLLGDIPWLGRLFSVDRESENRTELIVVMTPRILRDQQDLAMATESFLKSYRHLLPESVSAKVAKE